MLVTSDYLGLPPPSHPHEAPGARRSVGALFLLALS